MSAKLLQQFNQIESQQNQTIKTNSVCASSGKTTGFLLILHFVFRPALQEAFWQWFAWCLAHTYYSLNRKYSATPVIIEEKVIVRNRLRSWTGQKCELILKMVGGTENNVQWYTVARPPCGAFVVPYFWAIQQKGSVCASRKPWGRLQHVWCTWVAVGNRGLSRSRLSLM